MSGIATYLREQSPEVKIVLSDPEGSGLFNKVKYGVMFDLKEREGRKRRHQIDTVVSFAYPLDRGGSLTRGGTRLRGSVRSDHFDGYAEWLNNFQLRQVSIVYVVKRFRRKICMILTLFTRSGYT